MTALSVTATEVLPSTAAVLKYGTAGVAITAGQVCYLDTSANTWKLFDANLSSANAGQPHIALNSCSAGQPLTLQYGGLLIIGATAAPTAGLTYMADRVAGGIIPSADIASGDKVAIIGVAASASTIQLICWNSGASR